MSTQLNSYKERVKTLETSIVTIRDESTSEIQKTRWFLRVVLTKRKFLPAPFFLPKGDVVARLTADLKENEVLYKDLLDQR